MNPYTKDIETLDRKTLEITIESWINYYRELEDRILNLVANKELSPKRASWLLKYNSDSTLEARMPQ